MLQFDDMPPNWRSMKNAPSIIPVSMTPRSCSDNINPLKDNRPANNATGTRFSSTSSTFEGIGSPVREDPREDPPSYSSAVLQKYESFENPLAGHGSQSFGSQEDTSAQNPQFGKALYDFTAGGDDEVSLTAGEEVEIDYEVDGWYYVKKKRPGRDGRMAGLVPVLYVSSS